MDKRPFSVTIIGCVYLLTGVIGFANMLRGHNWARWLARLDRLPQFTVCLRNPGLFSLPPYSDPLLSGFRKIGDTDGDAQQPAWVFR